MAASYRFVVNGRVQGVGFRYSVVHVAQRLGLNGWVRNREDGAVEGLAQGEPSALERLRTWLQRGPPAAQVSEVQWNAAAAETCSDFSVRR